MTACTWDNPGADRYIGHTVAAVFRYTEIPIAHRIALAAKALAHAYSDRVEISRDAIAGTFDYAPTIRRMNFGQGRICDTVTRDKWGAGDRQGALVYFSGPYAIGVAAICGNFFVLDPLVPVSPTPRSTERAVVHYVPEPSSISLVLAALCVSGILAKRNRK